MPSVSIITPTLNEEGFITKLLTSIANQTQLPKEVIVVDNGSHDGTLKDVQTFADKLTIKVIETPETLGFIGASRNKGAATATGDMLLFLDADVEIDPTFIEDACREFAERKLDIAGAHFYVDRGQPLGDRIGGWLASRYHALFQYSKNPMGSGFCLLTTPALHRKIGGFNETYRHSEDHDFVQRAVLSGAKWRILHSPRFKLSTRRYQKQGKLKLFLLYTRAEINRIFFHYKFAPRERALYSFGIFSRPKK